jgi:hypothetical protein
MPDEKDKQDKAKSETFWPFKPGATVIYDPPSGWKYGFPKQYLPKEGESLADTMVRDGYPKEEAEWASNHTRFWEEENPLANKETPDKPTTPPPSKDATPKRGETKQGSPEPQPLAAARPEDTRKVAVTPEAVREEILSGQLERALVALEGLRVVGAAMLQGLEMHGPIGAKLSTELANVRDHCLYVAKKIREENK